MHSIQRANDYIQNNKNSVNPQYKPAYHASAEIGWINDPNGFSFYNSEFHLFYQFHPYSSKNGPMHWGHMISKDLVRWEHLPVSLAPDRPYDLHGCFSGSAIQDGDRHILMYTGHFNPDDNDPSLIRQTQCIAIGDGVTYRKLDRNPVLDANHLPAGASIQDFRDPKIWKEGDTFYAVIGSRAADDSGQLLLYRSLDAEQWEYVSIMVESKSRLGKMWECPDLFQLGDRDVLIVSPQFVEREGNRYHNQHSVVYMVGSLDRETGKFEQDALDELDYGLDFYAPQTTIDDRGRRIMIGWMQMWDRSIPSDQLGHGWSGMMTLPRVLRLEGQKLYQQPIEEIEQYRANHVSGNRRFAGEVSVPGVEGEQVEMIVRFTPIDATQFGIKVRKGEKEETVFSYNVQEQTFILDRSASGYPIQPGPGEEDVRGRRQVEVQLIDGSLHVRLFLDRSSVEAFIQLGLRTMSATIFPSPASKGIVFFADGEVEVDFNKWDLILS
ncbi:glycoside hydrolase family 32 protein [Cohnella hashimotonis]|uniref:Sucrose-6-phosphate hydrolase n=1 Tax=Cohnella hashimotonis TaxID=2826895 RepID=A0ABT6T9L2_9BACL|nr:glycoside hydrolase family 32 protein [Cohnella hashimotonis]MDI4643511.1 glycoside hydrolase family 32 protein [Cohnella hashimotonis]